MTAQMNEILEYNGETYPLSSQPLFEYLKQNHLWPIRGGSTACYRGYVARWKLENNQLFFLNFEYLSPGAYALGLDKLWQNMDEVLAYWFNGKLTLQMGERLKYIHSGWGSIYERDWIMDFEMGTMISERIVENTLESNS